MASIQFKGIDGAIEAYENRDVAPWSLWQGKQFMFKYEGNSVSEGAAQLQATLELLKESSNAVYTLKVYEELKGKIKSNTPDDGSFNFKLNGEEQAITQNQYASLKYSNNTNERLDKIEQLLLAREEEEDPEPENKLGMIGEIISHPTIAPIVQNILSAIFSKGQTTAPAQVPRVAISGINEESELKEAVETLKQLDPKLTEHLQKLVAVAQQSPESFKFLLTTLDNM